MGVVEFKSRKQTRTTEIMEHVTRILASNGIEHDAEVRSAAQAWVERFNVDLHCSASIPLPVDNPQAAALVRRTTDANVAALRKKIQEFIGSLLVDVIRLEVERALLRRELREVTSSTTSRGRQVEDGDVAT